MIVMNGCVTVNNRHSPGLDPGATLSGPRPIIYKLLRFFLYWPNISSFDSSSLTIL